MDENELIGALLGLGALLVVLIIVGIILYIYHAICLQAIAKKTGTPNGWLAWIPLAWYFLQTNIARMSWVLALILCIISVSSFFIMDQSLTWLASILSLAYLVLVIIIWVKICRACNKPGWWVVLLCIPIVNLIILGIMAFSKKSEAAQLPTA
jgi:hypothetical protein